MGGFFGIGEDRRGRSAVFGESLAFSSGSHVVNSVGKKVFAVFTLFNFFADIPKISQLGASMGTLVKSLVRYRISV